MNKTAFYLIPILGIVLIVIGMVGIYNYFSTSVDDVFDKVDTIDELVFSSPIVIDQDTLDVINTNWWNESVTLENGKVYDYAYIANKFLDKDIKRKIDSINNR